MHLAHACRVTTALVVRCGTAYLQCNNAMGRCTEQGSLMSTINVEYYAVSTGIVLTALVALVPFFA